MTLYFSNTRNDREKKAFFVNAMKWTKNKWLKGHSRSKQMTPNLVVPPKGIVNFLEKYNFTDT